MTLCPVALVIGCQRCVAFAVCPLKTVIGDYRPGDKPAGPAAKPKRAKRAKRGPKRAR